MAKTRRKRCEDCGDLYGFVPISRERNNKAALVVHNVIDHAGRATVFVVLHLVLLPLSSGLIVVQPLTFPLAQGVHWYLYGLAWTLFGLLELLAAEWITTCAMNYSSAASTKKRPSSATKDTSSWLSRVSPREYRAYLRRRDHIREHIQDRSEKFNEPDGQLEDAVSTISSVRNSVVSKPTSRQVSVTSTGIPVSIRESVRCKVCSRKTCIDKEHVVTASLKYADDTCSPAPSVASTGPPSAGMHSVGTVRKAAKLYLSHQLTLLLSVALPMVLGTRITANVDRFVGESARILCLVATYFLPLLKLPEHHYSGRLDRWLAYWLGNETVGAYVAGSIALCIVLVPISQASSRPFSRPLSMPRRCAQTYHHCIHCVGKLGAEYFALPLIVGAGSLVHGWVVLTVLNAVVDGIRSETRPGLLFWLQGVLQLSDHHVGLVVVEQWKEHAKRMLPFLLLAPVMRLASVRALLRSISVVPWHMLLSVACTGHLVTLLQLVLDSLFIPSATLEVLKCVAKRLSLSSLIFGGRFPEEDQSFPHSGRYSFVPFASTLNGKSLSLRKVRQVSGIPVEPVDIANMVAKQECRFKGFIVAFRPSYCGLRLACLLLLVGSFVTFSLGLALWVPHAVGRRLLAHPHGLVNWSIGYGLLQVSMAVVKKCIAHKGVLRDYAAQSMRAIAMLACHGVVNPLLLGLLYDNVVNVQRNWAVLQNAAPSVPTPTLLSYWKAGASFALCLALWSRATARPVRDSIHTSSHLTMLMAVPVVVSSLFANDSRPLNIVQRLSHPAMLSLVVSFAICKQSCLYFNK